MKIYLKVVISDGRVIERISCQYHKNVGMCDGGGDTDDSGGWGEGSGWGEGGGLGIEGFSVDSSLDPGEWGGDSGGGGDYSGGWEAQVSEGYGDHVSATYGGLQGATPDSGGEASYSRSFNLTRGRELNPTLAKVVKASAALSLLSPVAAGIAVLGTIYLGTQGARQDNIDAYVASGMSRAEAEEHYSAMHKTDIPSMEGMSEGETETALTNHYNSLTPQQQQQIGTLSNDLPALEGGMTLGGLGIGGGFSPEYNRPDAPDFEAVKAQLADIANDVKIATELRELGDLTGGLSDEETAILDRIEENSRLNMSEIVNSQTEDVMKSAIASMVDRGVLQGAIGAETLKRIDQTRTEILTRGYRDIASQRLGTEINLREAQKGRQMGLWQMEQSGALARAGIEQAGVLAGADYDWKKYLGETEQAQYETGIQTDWQKSLLDAYTRMYAADKSTSSAANIAAGYRESAKEASKWNAIGNITGSFINTFF